MGNGRYKSIKGYVLTLYKTRNGYLQIQFSKDGMHEKALVHRVVARAFIDNPQKLPCINHKDENRLNNRVSNLEWCTHKYNNNYGNHNKSLSNALKKSKKLLPIAHKAGMEHARPVKQLTSKGKLLKIYPSINAAGRALRKSSGSLIGKCCRGLCSAAYGYRWQYVNE